MTGIIILSMISLPVSAGTVHYVYDDLNRLVSIEYESIQGVKGTEVIYTYDDTGNRKSEEVVVPDDADGDGKEKGRFKGWSDNEIRQVIKESMNRARNDGTVRSLPDGRTAYYDRLTGRLSIRNTTTGKPSTSFIPDRGESYFWGLK